MRRKASISMDRHDLKFKNLAITANPNHPITDSSVVSEIISRLEAKYGKLLESYDELTVKYEVIKTFAREAVWEYNVANCDDFKFIPTLTANIVEEGAVVGDYCTDKLLHEGKFSSVITCNKRFVDERGISSFSDDKSFRKYALKIIDKGAINCVDNAIMVNNELRALRTLEPSMNIVGFESAFHTERCIYIVTEWFPTDLYKFMSAHHLVMNDKIVSIIIRKLLLGLAFLGANHIVHRDLKPENILIAFNDHKEFFVKICDFGLCQFVEPGNSTVKGVCGSAGFFAPETVVNASTGYCGFKADNFSVGCIVLELLSSPSFFRSEWLHSYEKAIDNCDAQLFEKSIHRAIMKAHSDATARYPSCVAEFIAGALHFEPSKRYTIQEMQYSRWLCMAERLEKPANIAAYFDFNDVSAVGRVIGSYGSADMPPVLDRHLTLKDLTPEWNSEQALSKYQASIRRASNIARFEATSAAAAAAASSAVAAVNNSNSKDGSSPVRHKLHGAPAHHAAIRRHRLAVSFDGSNLSLGNHPNAVHLNPLPDNCTASPATATAEVQESAEPHGVAQQQQQTAHHHEKKLSVELLVQKIPFSDIPPHNSFSLNSNLQSFRQDLADLHPGLASPSQKPHRHASAQLSPMAGAAATVIVHEDERVLHREGVNIPSALHPVTREMGVRYLHTLHDKKNAAKAKALVEDGGDASVSFVSDLQKQTVHEDNSAYVAFAQIQAKLCSFDVQDTSVVSTAAAATANEGSGDAHTDGHHSHGSGGGKHSTAMPRIISSTRKSGVASSLKFACPVR